MVFRVILMLWEVAASDNFLGILYGLFEVFPIIWGEIRGFELGQASLLFLGVLIGTTYAYISFICCWLALTVIYIQNGRGNQQYSSKQV